MLDEGLRQQLQVDKVRLFLAHWRASLLAVWVVTTVAVFAWAQDIPALHRLAWYCWLCMAYLAQAVLAWRLESAPHLATAMPRHMPWLLLAIGCGGLGWGLLPWLLAPASTQALVWVGVFNAMLLFCVANAPGTLAMVVCAVLPLSVPTILALLARGHPWGGIGFAALSLLSTFYGFRLQTALQTTVHERYLAQSLSQQLQEQQQQLLQAEHHNTQLQERQRLVHDMHDGLGSTLLLTLAAVERGQLAQPAVAQALRDCVADLRLVIDSLEPMDYDLVTMLATIRHRMEPRLQAAGLALQWDVQALPPLLWLQPSDILHLLRLVQEALANVLKHAHARQVRVRTASLGEQVEICIEDDGCGFDPAQAHPGRGYASQQHRARQLGGSLQRDSQPGHGTRLRLRLPVQRVATN